MSTDELTSDIYSREELYEMAWSEPMTAIGKRLGVSSSYLARVYTKLNVPRPAPGYWAKVAAGKPVKKPPLPEPEVGSEVAWDTRGCDEIIHTPKPRPPRKPKKKATRRTDRPKVHKLIGGSKKHFLHTRKLVDGYLRPYKKILVDIISSEKHLDTTLEVANQLYLALEDMDHRIALVPTYPNYRRAEAEERENPKIQRDPSYTNTWSPCRCTVVYVGTVAIGITLIEISESIEVRYVNGDYLPVDEPKAIRHAKLNNWSFTTDRNYPVKKYRLQAYSPYPNTSWTKQWDFTPDSDISRLGHKIGRELNEHAIHITNLNKQALAEAERRRIEWEEEKRQRAIEEEKRLREESLSKSRDLLLNFIEKWAEAKNIEGFVNELEEAVNNSPEHDQALLHERLAIVKDGLGRSSALEALLEWKSPDELYSAAKDSSNAWWNN